MSTDVNKAADVNTSAQPATAGAAVVENVTPAKPPRRSQAELRAEAARARDELAQTLDAIEYKLNVPRQLRHRSRRFTARLRDLGEKNPLLLAGIVLGAASAAVGAVWLGVKAVQRR